MKDEREIKPPVINGNITDEFLEFESGSTFELSFEIDANSPTEINMYKDEEIIEAGDKHIKIIKERNIVKLKIDELSTDDSGFYVIEAENEAGLVEKEIEINVKGNMGYFRGSCTEVLCKKGFLKNFAKITGKHQRQSFFFNKVADTVFL